MASTVALRGRPLAILLKQLLAEAPSASEKPVAAAAAATASRRMYNSELRRYDDDGDDDESGANEECNAPADDRRRAARDINVPCFFSTSDVLDPYGAPTSLGRLLALMEDTAAPRRGWWVAKEDDDAVHFKIPLPGLGKEHVKVWAEQNGLVIKGEGEKDPEDDADAAPLRYTSRIELPADAFKMDKIKAEMKNGMLRVAVPKLKEEERKDVFQVKVE